MNLHDARLNTLESVSILRTMDDKQKLSLALGNLATIEYWQGNVEDALVYARESVEFATELSLLTLKGYLLCTVGSILAYSGQYAHAQEAFNDAQQALARTEDDLCIAWWQFSYARE